MPGLTGVEAAPLVRERRDPPAVVFVTAHEHYAVEAFAVEAFDYLLKPVDPERLARVVERLRERTTENAAPVEKIPVVAGGGTELLDFDQVHYVQADGDYSRVHTYDRSYLCTASLGELEERLGGALRAHPPLVPRQPRARSPAFAARRRTGSACSSPTRRRPSSTSRAASRASCASGSGSRAAPEQLERTPSVDRRTQVGALAELRRAFGRDDRDAHRDLEPVERGEAVEVGGVVAGVERARAGPSPASSARTAVPLSRRPAAAPRAPCVPSACGSPASSAARRDRLERRRARRPGRRRAVVERDAQRLQLRRGHGASAAKRVDPAGPVLRARVELEAVLADVGQLGRRRRSRGRRSLGRPVTHATSP